jgi:hypothetical protein
MSQSSLAKVKSVQVITCGLTVRSSCSGLPWANHITVRKKTLYRKVPCRCRSRGPREVRAFCLQSIQRPRPLVRSQMAAEAHQSVASGGTAFALRIPRPLLPRRCSTSVPLGVGAKIEANTICAPTYDNHRRRARGRQGFKCPKMAGPFNLHQRVLSY